MRRSNSETTMDTFSSRASAEKRSVEGPGTGSARSNIAGFSSRQKYCERNNSGRQMICAPFPAASRTRHSAFDAFSSGFTAQAIWIRPTRNLACRTFLL